ncbi:glycosyltransferase [Kutzneria sp. NPDC051319]|uniref:glycosyltransferase n=1 Tax=Kutzneria sp. NPDC051319 TaxID=3155047 RepID=UPI0034343DE5
MRVGICDFPSQYAFPPFGYGGIERWLWAAAIGAYRAGAEVHLLGPAWRQDLVPGMPGLPVRLEDIDRDAAWRAVERLGLDLLIGGHEYPSHPTWRAAAAALGCDVATFQHDPNFRHAADAFDGMRSRLYCYSPEMVARYSVHRPQQTLSVQFGLGEEDPEPAADGTYLAWLGRIDRDKAPHLAAMAAAKLGMRLRIIGPVLDSSYVAEHASVLEAPYVDFVGELTGPVKLRALKEARALVYTCGRDYVEAGAAVFGEALRCGTPVAASVWGAGTCAQAALCNGTGAVAEIGADDDDESAAAALADAISTAIQLEPRAVQEIGLARFDPAEHFRVLAGGVP